MSKKLVALALALMLALTATSFALAFAPVAQNDLKVGFVFIGEATDGYTGAHYKGSVAMQKELGLRDDQLVYKFNTTEDAACEAAMRELIEDGCQIIFGNSFNFMDYMAEMAVEYPNVIFSHCSGFKSNDTNFNNYFGRIYQARYLSGIAAGLKTTTNKIGFVAAFPISEVVGGLNAFALGAQSVNPNAVVYVKYINSWFDPTQEKATAEALIALGCDVIGQHCDTAMPQIAAQEAGVYGCGYNTDMTVDAPNAHLCAPIWNWGTIYTAEVKAVLDGTWAPVNLYFGLAEGLVDLSPLSANCAEGTAAAIDTARAKILSGTWDVFYGPLYDNTGVLKVAEGDKLSDADITGNLTWYVQGVIEQ
jgi:basic membrane protein A and related proteins